MKSLRLFWGSWIIVTSLLKILNWRSEMLRMSTPEKQIRSAVKIWWSLKMIKLACVTARELMLTTVLFWCHQLPFEWWKSSERRPAFGNEPLMYTLLLAWQVCQVHIVAIRFPISVKTLLYASFVYWRQISLKCFHFTSSFPFRPWFCSLMYGHFNFFLTN